MKGDCPICDRKDIDLTIHHLIPKTCHDNMWFKKRYSGEEMKAMVLSVCRLCHNKIHDIEKEKVLGKDFNTLEKLLVHEEIKKFIPFAMKQKY
jgi:5-methylcytosine-specific restriction endonuclease McrA